jgi:putative endonuclease
MTAESRTRKPLWRRWFGTRSERAAARFLRRERGYRILRRNFSCPRGELDIIALDGDCLIFVEVRSTEGEDSTVPVESVDHDKQRRLTDLALIFLQRHRLLGLAARFDILAVCWPPDRSEPIIEHFPNAFQPTGRFQMYT